MTKLEQLKKDHKRYAKLLAECKYKAMHPTDTVVRRGNVSGKFSKTVKGKVKRYGKCIIPRI